MYQIESSGDVLKSRPRLSLTRLKWPHVSRTVLLLGLTSLFTDISSEMVSTILPLYLIFSLRLAPLEFGIIDGLYQGAAAIVRLAGGFAADRWQRHKEIATAGYAISAACKVAFLAVGGVWTALASVVIIDRIGKGIRTAPRDALISFSTPKDQLATAFGVHRAMDTAGAMIGPLIAFGLLAFLPRSYDVVFVVSFCIALIGLGVIALFVRNQPAATEQVAKQPVLTLALLGDLLRMPRFRTLVLAGAALGLVTMSDSFLYLGFQRRLNFSVGFFPLLYVVTAAVYMVLAIPIGKLADRIGRYRVFVGGYVLLILVYTSLLMPTLGTIQIGLYLLVFGTYYAATDGVLSALASTLLPVELRSSGLSLLGLPRVSRACSRRSYSGQSGPGGVSRPLSSCLLSGWLVHWD